eukprot:TRINITY_DN2187_c0_g1_i6.p1 TRINITY_DN2187_c0_g1~~TRINITY_DN2187_c0_g1_i6.p1  ORF type:complete len:539 (+),score=164.76 TRINITY_DN2187_c0_g1_i6:266-1882(+)
MGTNTQKMVVLTVFAIVFLAIGCLSQNTGDVKENVALKFPIEVCQSEGNCQKVSTSVSLDSNWHWIHDSSGTNCYDGNLWDSVRCPDPATCTANCVLEGSDQADWGSTYGVTVDGSGGMTLQFVTVGQYSTNIGSRMFLLDESGDAYYMFKLKNKEFTMDVDTSELPCGLNGAVYFVEMDADGGLHYPSNKAGPPYGTGYCDAQCPHDLKWVNGEANCETWIPSDVDPNSGFGKYGSCCFELDIWEANTISTAFTNHPCDVTGQFRCESPEECGDNGSNNRYDGVCDKDGCDFNHWRMGDETFYGPGSNFKVDSTKPLTLVTQFITDDGTDNGNLVEMRRIYLQNGNIIANNVANIPGMQAWDSVSQPMCDEQKKIFNDPDDHTEKGGMKTMGESMDRGQVLVMSIWADTESHMLWLDSTFPADSSPSEPGNSRGSCPTDSGVPSDLQNNYGSATVKYFNVKIGPLGSTFPGDAPTTTTSGPNPTPSTSTSGPGPTTTTNGGGNTCPGGSLDVCISLCPEEPAEIYQKCVQQCIADCT